MPRGIAHIEQRGLRYMLVVRIGQAPRVVSFLGHFHTDASAVSAAHRALRRLVYHRCASAIDLDPVPRKR